MPRECVLNLETVATIPKDALRQRLAVLSPSENDGSRGDLRFALGLQR